MRYNRRTRSITSRRNKRKRMRGGGVWNTITGFFGKKKDGDEAKPNPPPGAPGHVETSEEYKERKGLGSDQEAWMGGRRRRRRRRRTRRKKRRRKSRRCAGRRYSWRRRLPSRRRRQSLCGY